MVLSLSQRLSTDRPSAAVSGHVTARSQSRKTDVSESELPDVGKELGDGGEVTFAHTKVPERADVSKGMLSEITELEGRLAARVDALLPRMKALEDAACAAEDTAGAADRLGLQMAALHTAVQDLARERPTQVLPPILHLREELRTEFNARFEDLRAAVDKRLTGMRSSLDSLAPQSALSAAPAPLPAPSQASSKDTDALEEMRVELGARHDGLRTEVDKRLCSLSAAIEDVARRTPATAAARPSPATERSEKLVSSARPTREQAAGLSSTASPDTSEFSRRSGSYGTSSDSYHPLSSALSFSEERVGTRDLSPTHRKPASMSLPSSLGEASAAAGLWLAGVTSRVQPSRLPTTADLTASSSSSRHPTPGRTEWDNLQVMGEGRRRGEPVLS